MEREKYENGDVILYIDKFDGQVQRYWIQSGVTSISFNQTQIEQLTEMLNALMEETNG